MSELNEGFIGLNIEVKESKNKTLKGLKGKIIDETKNTFKIETQEKVKTILKNSSKFIINGKEINGEKISKRSYDRIKIKNG